ncbi:MAG TPA: ABC transporter permease, partial [Ilumatobacteraceae bacterium]|nr:ABC transporter permease [Ilumatobacteraceae bacterium]
MRYVGQRVIQLLIVVLAVTFTVSLALSAMPNAKERVILSRGAGLTDEVAKQKLLDELHLNDSIPTQYVYFVKDLVSGNWGVTNQNEAVTSSIWSGLGVSVKLMIYGQLIALLIAIPVAINAAYRGGGLFDRMSTTTAFGFLATPAYILAPVLILLLAVRWQIFPARSKNIPIGQVWEHFRNFFLPSITLAIPLAAGYMRLLRADMVLTLQSDFITTARAKGMSTFRILFGHALRPSLFSLLTSAAINVGTLVGGAL